MASNCTFGAGDACQEGMASSVLEAITEFGDAQRLSRPRPLVNSEIKALLEIYINSVTFMVTSLLGIVANVVNITVYWKQGLRDGITLGFFVLSISDMILVSMTFCASVLYTMKALMPNFGINVQAIHYVSSATMRNMCYSMSSDLTAFLSVERCCCVIFPFKVKIIFSRSRSAAIILAIVSFHCLCFIPLFATHQLHWVPTPTLGANGTTSMRYVLRVYLLPYRQEIEQFNTIMTGIVTPTVSQAIVTICIIILIYGLRQSSKFRKSIATTAGTIQASKTSASGRDEGHTNVKGQLTSRDARLVKTMIILVIIFSISNVPLLMITYAKRLVPELNFRRAYHNLVTLAYSIIYLLSSINATANVLVYYNTSTRFRDITRSLFSCSSRSPAKS